MGKTKSGNSSKKQKLHETKSGSVKKNKLVDPYEGLPDSTVDLFTRNLKQMEDVYSSFKMVGRNAVEAFPNNENNKTLEMWNKQISKELKGIKKKNRYLDKLAEQQNSLKEKSNSSKEKQSSPKKKYNSPNASQNKHKMDKKNKLELGKLEMKDSSDFDIDEGIKPQKYNMESTDESSESEEESDTNVPNILGASLAEESDEDDEDFEDKEEEEDEDDKEMDVEEDEEEEEKDKKRSIENKGMKKFKGIKSKTEDKNLELIEEEEDDDDDDCYDEEGEEEFNNDSDYDNIFVTDEKTELKQTNNSSSESEDDEKDDEKDDENDDSEEDDEKGLGITSLLGKPITDDDDDSDFNKDDEDDEDDDISYEDDDDEEYDILKAEEKRAKAKKQLEKQDLLFADMREEVDKRTISIDNIPKETKVKSIKKVFGQYGPIESIRFRAIIPKDPKMSKKVAAITDQIHPKATTVVVYVMYKFQESAKKALGMNGKTFKGNYVNVKIVAKSQQPEYDNQKAVFIGNLKFGMYYQVLLIFNL